MRQDGNLLHPCRAFRKHFRRATACVSIRNADQSSGICFSNSREIASGSIKRFVGNAREETTHTQVAR